MYRWRCNVSAINIGRELATGSGYALHAAAAREAAAAVFAQALDTAARLTNGARGCAEYERYDVHVTIGDASR